VTGSRARGFTLLELIVSLMVFAALSALVYGTVRIGSRSWQAGTERIDEADALRIGWTFVQRALTDSRAEPSLVPDVPGVHFLGGPNAVELVAELPAHLGVGGLHVLRLGLEDEVGAGVGQLVLGRAPLRPVGETDRGREDARGMQETVLAEGVTGLAFRYYGALTEIEGEGQGPAEGGARRWHLQWQGQESLPELVMVTVQLEGGTHWPLLVAHPRLGERKAPADGAEAEPDASSVGAIDEGGRRATVD
jgi:general secretion pathway protein J